MYGAMQLMVVLIVTAMVPCGFAADWWELETEMQKGGILSLVDKPWWKQACDLKTGEQFVLASAHPDGGMMIVRREKRTRTRSPEDMIVWILDDDKDMDANRPEGDQDSDCYIVDYGCDGVVDRMVDYIDVNNDQIPNEMEIRYFVDGELRRAWFGNDLDGDGSMWDLADYEYTGDFFRSDPYGNGEIYMNKYNPNDNTWLPISECPFAFYDTDGDGESEIAVRFSVAPLSFSPRLDPDYANQQSRYEGGYDPSMTRMGVMNVRYSFDVDGMSTKDNPLHYEMGFTMSGSLPYEFPLMNRNQPLRRSPKWTVCIRHDQARNVSEKYVAEQTGFTWREFEDAGLRIGHPSRPDYDRRWEGVFWTWSRRIIHNTGGPIQDWNVRREYMPTSSNRRFLYYSPIDRRLHLKGAAEGWIQIGRIENQEPLGEIRMLDTDNDGYFERWEYYTADSAEPYRVVDAETDQNLDFNGNWQEIFSFYNDTILPESIQLNEALIKRFEQIDASCSTPLPPNLSQALQREISPDENRYLLDIIRELRYRQFRAFVRDWNKKQANQLPMQDPRSDEAITRRSTRIWEAAMCISRFEMAYENGHYKNAIEIIDTIREMIHEKD
ncbi:MAG: hypothetical protein C4527_20885 [Candidatus Omnitrophota bacterium]|jgi:hypothetical protein|nr:MAG: hypothetical protein C4527_20885 [Candidatus Omnitrophota bacterium]